MKSETGLRTASGLTDKDEPIYQALMTARVGHQLPPGSKLPEEALSEVFGASRTGRRVLQCLATVQMIVLMLKCGAQAATSLVEEAQDIFRPRALIEYANLPAVLDRCQSTHLVALAEAMRPHFVHSLTSLHFERGGETLPYFARLFAGFELKAGAKG